MTRRPFFTVYGNTDPAWAAALVSSFAGQYPTGRIGRSRGVGYLGSKLKEAVVWRTKVGTIMVKVAAQVEETSHAD